MKFEVNANPINGNPFKSRQDAQQAVIDLTNPLMSAFSPGKARVHLGSSEAHFDTAAAHLEGLARPLWGLAPLLAGGGSFDGIEAFVEGLANGADPDHPEYWGPVRDRDQRMVESAAIGYALALAPETFWDGMSDRGRSCLKDWLLASLQCSPPGNNWHFFHVMVSLGLTRVGVAHDQSIIESDLDTLESYAMDAGWYRDGMDRRADHYIPFAMHFYCPGARYAAIGRATFATGQVWTSPIEAVSCLLAMATLNSMNLGRSAEKYNKFAYSSRYAFSVEAEARCFSNGPRAETRHHACHRKILHWVV